VVCVLCCLLGVVGVWVLLTGLVVPEWLGQPGGSFGSLVTGSTRLWLLAQGVPLAALGMRVSLVPLGLTLLLVVVSAETCRYSARAMSAARRSSGRPVSARNACQVAALHAMVHLTAVLVAAGAVNSGQWGRAVFGGLVVGLLPALAGALSAIGTPVAGLLPGRLRDVCAGAAAGCAVAVAGGAVALAVGLIGHSARMVELHNALGAGVWGGVVLIILQLAWLPDLMVWWASWTLGPGFQVGAATSVSPFGVHLGLVPSFPVLAALPSGGVGGLARLWLLVPVLAGVIAALVTSRRLASRRLAPGRLASGGSREESPASKLALTTAAGLVGGLALGVLGALSGGGIGPGRLAVMGPVMPAMAGMALVLLGGAAAVTGGVVAALDWRRTRVPGLPDPEAAEDTVKVSGARTQNKRAQTKRPQTDR
jgi:hypothetical protein